MINKVCFWIMKLGRSTRPTPPVCSLVVSVQRGTLHGLELSISIIVSRLLVFRFDNVTACTVHCIHPNRSVASAEVPGAGEGCAEASGFGCAAPKAVQRLSLSCIGRLWPFTEEHLRAVHLPSKFSAHYYSSTASPPTVTTTHDRN